MYIDYKWYDRFMVVIMILGLIFRLFNFDKGFSFAYDQDLYSWIAKDILVNHHQRLIGQMTSVEGVFIGSAYYYVMALFYWIFKLNPLSAVIPTVAGGMATIASIYWIFKRHFGRKTGLIGSFIYALSFGLAAYDRWSVPTQPTMLWSVWYLFVILEALKGNKKVIYLYAVLLGLIWQIHMALLPLALLAPLAHGFKKLEIRRILLALLLFLLVSSPLMLFELKYNFSQSRAIMIGPLKDMGGPTGKIKLLKVLNASGREIQTRLFFGWDRIQKPEYFWLGFLILTAAVYFKKKNLRRQLFILSLWPVLIMAFQFWSKRVVSEYYFSNMLPVIILILSIALGEIRQIYLILSLGLGYLLLNSWWLLTKCDLDHSYYYRNKMVKAIKANMVEKKYPCVAVNFIADPGWDWGFRYLWWYNKVRVVKAITPNVPIYNVFVPAPLGDRDGARYFGRFGVVEPKITKDSLNPSDCNKTEFQLDPMPGYVDQTNF